MVDLKDQLRNPNYANSSAFARAYMTEAADRIAALEAQLAETRKALAALDRMNRGVDWCDHDEQARRWSAARRALDGGRK